MSPIIIIMESTVIKVTPFTYTITYFTTQDSLMISCTHNTELHKWETTIDKTKLTSLSPKQLFELLCNYRINSSELLVSATSPDSEFTFSVLSRDATIVERFSLSPVKVPELELYGKIVNEQNKLISLLQSEIASLKKIIELLHADKQPAITHDKRNISKMSDDDLCDCKHVSSEEEQNPDSDIDIISAVSASVDNMKLIFEKCKDHEKK